MDLAITNFFSENISILLGYGTGSFETANNLTGSAPPYIAVADFNNYDKLYRAVAKFGSISLSVILGKGYDTFGTVTNFPVGNAPSSITVGDCN